jgi:hypothetical protein
MGYLLIAFVVGTSSGVFLICASVVLFARGHFDLLLTVEATLYCLGVAFVGLTLIRWSQGQTSMSFGVMVDSHQDRTRRAMASDASRSLFSLSAPPALTAFTTQCRKCSSNR